VVPSNATTDRVAACLPRALGNRPHKPRPCRDERQPRHDDQRDDKPAVSRGERSPCCYLDAIRSGCRLCETGIHLGSPFVSRRGPSIIEMGQGDMCDSITRPDRICRNRADHTASRNPPLPDRPIAPPLAHRGRSVGSAKWQHGRIVEIAHDRTTSPHIVAARSPAPVTA
jgi:hypothetical protein